MVRAITSGPNRRIAVCFVEWATTGMQTVVVDWTLVADGDSARGFGDRLVEVPRSFAGSTSISSAIDFSVDQLERAPFQSNRRVIDISGDGNNNSGRPVTEARDDAIGKGITINGLVILTPPGNRSGRSTRIRRAAWKNTSRTTSSAVLGHSRSLPKDMSRSAEP